MDAGQDVRRVSGAAPAKEGGAVTEAQCCSSGTGRASRLFVVGDVELVDREGITTSDDAKQESME